MAGRESVILALLVLGIGAGAVLGVLNQPPPRQRTTEVVTPAMPAPATIAATSIARWQMFESTRLGYRFIYKNSDTPGRDYTQNGIFIEATYTF